MLKHRLVPAALIVIVTVAAILCSRYTRILFFTACMVASLWELHTISLSLSHPILPIFGYLYTLVLAALCTVNADILPVCIAYFFFGTLILFYFLFRPTQAEQGLFANLGVFIYPLLPYSFILRIAAGEEWLPVLAFSVLGSWACDSMALIGGKLFGRRKLAPQVSPNKTWEGAFIGACFSVPAGMLISLILSSYCSVPAWQGAIVCLISSTLGQFGDLFASLLKRVCHTKDFSNLLGEHGGIMDKMDSMLFSVPTAWLCLKVLSAL